MVYVFVGKKAEITQASKKLIATLEKKGDKKCHKLSSTAINKLCPSSTESLHVSALRASRALHTLDSDVVVTISIPAKVRKRFTSIFKEDFKEVKV